MFVYTYTYKYIHTLVLLRNTHIYVCVHVCLYVYKLIDRTPPPREGFLFSMFPDQEPCERGPLSKNLVQILPGRSSYTRFLMRDHSK